MLFRSQATTLTQGAYRKAILQQNQRRKEEAARKLDYYHGEQLDHLLASILRDYANPEKLRPYFLNVVRKVVNNRAKVYMQDATRTLDASDADKATYAELEHVAGLPVKMKQANRLSFLCGNVLLRPLWRGGRMDVDVLTPDFVDVITGDSPEDVLAVIITHTKENGRVDEIEYSLWTAEEVVTLNYNGIETAKETNPYGILPFVSVFADPPTDSYWRPGAKDLMNAQDSVNERLTQLCYVLNFQSFGMAYTKGVNMAGSETPVMGPGLVWNLDKDGDLGFAAPNAPISESIAAIEFIMKQAAIMNGLSAASVSTETRKESGVSKVMDSKELEETRRDDIAMFAQYEHQLFKICRIVWNYHNPGRKIAESAEFSVNFYDPKPETSGLEQAREWELLLDKGLISPVDIMLERDPDLSNREEAKKRLKEIQAEIAEFTPRNDSYMPSFGVYTEEE